MASCEKIGGLRKARICRQFRETRNRQDFPWSNSSCTRSRNYRRSNLNLLLHSTLGNRDRAQGAQSSGSAHFTTGCFRGLGGSGYAVLRLRYRLSPSHLQHPYLWLRRRDSPTPETGSTSVHWYYPGECRGSFSGDPWNFAWTLVTPAVGTRKVLSAEVLRRTSSLHLLYRHPNGHKQRGPSLLLSHQDQMQSWCCQDVGSNLLIVDTKGCIQGKFLITVPRVSVPPGRSRPRL